VETPATGAQPSTSTYGNELESLVGKSSRSSIETVADALSDAKDEVWERTFDIAKPQRAKRGRRAGKGVALLALLGGAGFVVAKNRETAASAAKSAAGKGSSVAKSAAGKGSSVAKTATEKGKVVGTDLKGRATSVLGSIKTRRNKS
jgi:hypothetical protein